ncbi:group II intron maturase-specific domain-containing protein [Pasteuria penetrans]|uniref:group II intron maturase-specific domain-containing protein n=1 Tax=Pasteuria penetrans TaxID=86005 RepID=UPI0011ECAFF1|nr:group II intron maturase-specific domain-containing protein [Pasteuria penetrans]
MGMDPAPHLHGEDVGILDRGGPKTGDEPLLHAKPVGWLTYYGAFYPSSVKNFSRDHINQILARWAAKKYKKLNNWKKALKWVRWIRRKYRRLFVHW